jgi:hypothetical protein
MRQYDDATFVISLEQPRAELIDVGGLENELYHRAG